MSGKKNVEEKTSPKLSSNVNVVGYKMRFLKSTRISTISDICFTFCIWLYMLFVLFCMFDLLFIIFTMF